MIRLLTASAMALVLTVVACGDDSNTVTQTTTTTTTTVAPATGDPETACAALAEANAMVVDEGLGNPAIGDLYRTAAAEAVASGTRPLEQAGAALQRGIERLEQADIAAAVLLFDAVCADLGH